jgi:hypothetical protein
VFSEFGRILPLCGRTGLSAPIPRDYPLQSLARFLTAAFFSIITAGNRSYAIPCIYPEKRQNPLDTPRFIGYL